MHFGFTSHSRATNEVEFQSIEKSYPFEYDSNQKVASELMDIDTEILHTHSITASKSLGLSGLLMVRLNFSMH